jgi:holo-[acyl-carrier protein] synthase
MIKGIGIDIVEISRIEKMIRTYGSQFLRKVFTETEIEYCRKMAKPPVHFAGRWAAKEAFYKALPQECQKISGWKSVEVVAEGTKTPALSVCDAALAKAMKKNGVEKSHVTMSHEKSVCVALTVLEGGK